MKVFILPLLLLSSLLVAEPDQDLDFEELLLGPDGNPTEPNPASGIRFAAAQTYQLAKGKIAEDYKRAFAEAFIHADRIEITLLDCEPIKATEIPNGERKNYFPIKPYGTFSRILNRKEVPVEKLPSFKEGLRNLFKKEAGSGAFCHFPIHGIEVFSQGELLFQTSLCWLCHNYYIEFPDDYETATWVGIWDEDFKKLITDFLPIPESELRRVKRTK